ncbi:MAG: hypothetical protein RL381_643 [Actinomycetota bacterium]
MGSINADLITYVDDSKRIGNYVFGEDFRFNIGGKGLNQALNVSASGQPVVLLGRVGNDFFGKEILSQLDSHGIDFSHVVIDPIAHTGIGHVRVSLEGEYDTVVVNGANSFLGSEQIDAVIEFGISASYVLMNYEILSNVVMHASEKFRAIGAKTIINLSPIAEGVTYSVSAADYLVTNDDEARSVLNSNETNPFTLAKLLQENGAKNVIITLGSDGVIGIDQDGGEHRIGREQIAVENTIGAGDTFLSVFAVSLNDGKDFRSAIEIANFAAAMVCTKKESFLSKEDMNVIGEKFKFAVSGANNK